MPGVADTLEVRRGARFPGTCCVVSSADLILAPGERSRIPVRREGESDFRGNAEMEEAFGEGKVTRRGGRLTSILRYYRRGE
jgi:hypothetical protein